MRGHLGNENVPLVLNEKRMVGGTNS